MQKQSLSPAQLKFIYLAMLFGASTIGSVFLFLRIGGQGIAASESTLATMRMICYGLIITQVSLLFVLRNLRSKQPPEARSSFTLTGWALAEGAAILGALFIPMGGEPWPWAGGLAMLVLAGQLLPGDGSRE